MSSPFLSLVSKFAFLLVLASVASAQQRELRVCADPDNMPFSNKLQQGFENRLAELVAANVHAKLTYVWQRMGRGFVREYIDKSKCDLLIGIPANYRPLLTTTPYYRSIYVFVFRRDHPLRQASFDSTELHGLKIGVQVMEEDYTPPGEALARRGLQSSIIGFDTTGDQAGSLVRAVADRTVDVAAVWGPLAGYFVGKYAGLLQFTPVTPEFDPPGLPFTFAISMGVRKGNVALRDELEKILTNNKDRIETILKQYGVPELPLHSAISAQSAGN